MTEDTSGIKKGKHLFQKGQSGNPAGRPKGARSKLSEAFTLALHDDFKKHGLAAVQEVRETKPDQYLRVIAQIVPKEIEAGEELAKALTVEIIRLADEE